METTTAAETAATTHDFVIQPAPASALEYVLSSWGRMLEQRLEARPMPGFLTAFAPIQAKLIRRSTVLCAMRGERIIAFAVFEPASASSPGVLHWVYTRLKEQRQGAARALLKAAKLERPIITCWTSDLRHIGLADAQYTPFWLRT
jgi:hypothetical protein